MMTIDELAEYRGLAAERDALREELKHVYETVRSPRLDGTPGARRSMSKTEQSALAAAELSDKLACVEMEIVFKLAAIEDFIEEVDDPLIRASLRQHFILGRTWRETSAIVYGARASKETARLACRRLICGG